MTTEQLQKITDIIKAQLEENISNRLTPATATGILTLCANQIQPMVSAPDTKSPS